MERRQRASAHGGAAGTDGDYWPKHVDPRPWLTLRWLEGERPRKRVWTRGTRCLSEHQIHQHPGLSPEQEILVKEHAAVFVPFTECRCSDNPYFRGSTASDV